MNRLNKQTDATVASAMSRIVIAINHTEQFHGAAWSVTGNKMQEDSSKL